MIVSDLAISRSTTVLVLLLLIVAAGVYCYNALPREADPEIIIPSVMVATTYMGVSPEDIETLITIPIERQLTGLPGVESFNSYSLEGYSSIRIEFQPDIEVKDALQRVRDKVDFAKPDLPEEADDPRVMEINYSEYPMMFISFSGDVGLAIMSKFAEDLRDEIETVHGVLKSEIIGDVEREIQIIVDPDRIAQYGIALTDLVNLMRLENVNTPGGVFEVGGAKFLMRVPGEFKNPDELNNLVVKVGAAGIVHLSDIAEIRDGFKRVTSRSRLNGAPNVTLTVTKRAGENIIGIADEVKQLIATAQEELTPLGIDITITTDMSRDIKESVAQLESSVLSGLFLVLVVIFLFMGFFNALFVSMAIPLSILMTFCVFLMTGVTLNQVTLFSLTLSLGMLVDNGIVIVENIYRHYQTGMSRVEAARKGSAEVALPVIASTITTVGAFSPLFFWPGMMGNYMRYLPRTVSITLVASLFVALVVNPAIASRFMHIRRSALKVGGDKVKLSRTRRAYRAFLLLTLRWRAATMTTAVTALAMIGVLYVSSAKIEFMPSTEVFFANVDISCPQGTDLDTSDAITKEVEALVLPYKDHMDYIIASIGSQSSFRSSGGSSGGASTHLSQLSLRFPSYEKTEVGAREVLDTIRPKLADIPGAKFRIESMRMGPSSGTPVSIEISGKDFSILGELSDQVQELIGNVRGVVDVRDNFDRGKPEVRVTVDRERAWQVGLNTQLIGLMVRGAVDGLKAGEYREGDEEFDVMIRFPEAFRRDFASIGDMNLITQAGVPVPFSSVAKIEQGFGLGAITHKDRRRTITVNANVAGRSTAETLIEVKALLGGMNVPSDYRILLAGENQRMEETQGFLFRAFFIGLFIIALVLITQFNSLTQPLIILSSVLLSLGGAMFGLYICKMPFVVLMSGLGCISLAGIVVNNAIVLIDFINQQRAQGVPTRDAIVDACVIRFRPVMLTAVTTILGLVPMAVGVSFNFRRFAWVVGGRSSEFWSPMAVTIIFGLAFATVLTLIVVPVLYSLNESFTNLTRKKPPEASTPTIA